MRDYDIMIKAIENSAERAVAGSNRNTEPVWADWLTHKFQVPSWRGNPPLNSPRRDVNKAIAETLKTTESRHCDSIYTIENGGQQPYPMEMPGDVALRVAGSRDGLDQRHFPRVGALVRIHL